MQSDSHIIKQPQNMQSHKYACIIIIRKPFAIPAYLRVAHNEFSFERLCGQTFC